jgi:acyl carrier protein
MPIIHMQLEVVRLALALHLSIDPVEIELEHRLDEDLGLDPLDLVLVVLRLEEIEEAEFPVADLETVTTVADLVSVVRAWSNGDRSATLPPPPPATEVTGRHTSGIQSVAHAVIRSGRAANG